MEGRDGEALDAATRTANDELKYLAQQVELLKERLRNTPERDNESRAMQDLRLENEHLKVRSLITRLIFYSPFFLTANY